MGSSNTFSPDFLWPGDHCYAINPTGAHILEDRIRGKLLAIAKVLHRVDRSRLDLRGR